jgi:REP element-mobilizing transposase RayT
MNNNNNIKLLPINFGQFRKNKILINTRNIDSYCENNDLYEIIKKDDISINKILEYLDKLLFPSNNIFNILNVSFELYGIATPNMIVLVILSIILNENLNKETKTILCNLKNNSNGNNLNNLLKKIKQKHLFIFLTKLLCATKNHIYNILDNPNNHKVKKIMEYITNKSNNGIKKNIILEKNNENIIGQGLTTILYFGFLINNIFYESYINQNISIKELKSLLSKSPNTINDSLLFCVYIYDFFNYIVQTLLMPNYFSTNTKKINNLMIGNYTYNPQIGNNKIIKQIINLEKDYFKLYKNITQNQLILLNLNKFILEKQEKQEEQYIVKRNNNKTNLKINETFITITPDKLLIDNNTIQYSFENDVLIIKLSGSLLKGSNDNFGFDGYNIYKIQNNKPLCNIGYVSNVNNNVSFYFKRPLLNDYLKLSTVEFKKALGRANIKMNNVYTLMEFIIIINITYALMTNKIQSQNQSQKKIEENCTFYMKTKNMNIINC